MGTKVYILGAGASKPAGTPLLNEFIGEGFFHLMHGSAFPDSLTNYLRFTDYLKKEYGFDLWSPDPFRRYPEIVFKGTNIEEIISSIDGKISEGDTDLIEVRREAVRFVYCTLENAVTSISNRNCYPDFVGKKIADSTDEHIILTFNYEMILEVALIRNLDLDCISYEIDVDENKIINFPGYRPYKNKIKILKLHGSLNWAFCQNCSKMHLFWFNRYDLIFEEKCVDCEGNLEPILIAPTRDKKLPIYLEKLWGIAKEKITVADEISIIGCALNDYDKDALALIIDSIEANKKIPKLLIADPKAEEIEKKITSRIPRNHFNCINLFEGFREYLE